VIRIGEGPPSADRDKTRVADLREDQLAITPAADWSARLLRSCLRETLARTPIRPERCVGDEACDPADVTTVPCRGSEA
jgi:hypothetical protein